MKLLVTVIVILSVSVGHAKKTKKKKRKSSRVSAVVMVDGAAVYKFANFDAPIIEYYEKGRKIRVYKKIYQGIGGLGTFYKVRIKKGVYGYITDVDIRLSSKKASGNKVRNQNDKKAEDPFSTADINEDDMGDKEPLYFKRYLGIVYGSVNYTETVLSKKESANIGFMGIKMSGPGTLFDGPPIDFEFLFFMDAPEFYDKASDVADASGFLIMGSLLFTLPGFEFSHRSGLVYYGVGLSYLYTKFDVKQGGKTIDSQEMRLGAAANLGVAYELSPKLLFKLEGKYYYEVEHYAGYFGAIQYRY